MLIKHCVLRAFVELEFQLCAVSSLALVGGEWSA